MTFLIKNLCTCVVYATFAAHGDVRWGLLLFLRINRDFCPNVIEIEYFGNYERFWILCRSQCWVHFDTDAPFVQYQETPDASD